MVEADRNMFEDVSDKKLKLDSFQSESKIVKKVFLAMENDLVDA